jgi:hypothetical protein
MNQLEVQACTAEVGSAMRPNVQGSFALLEKFLQWQSQIWFDHSRTETQASSVPASGLNNGESGAMAKSTMNGTGMMPIRKRNPLTLAACTDHSATFPPVSRPHKIVAVLIGSRAQAQQLRLVLVSCLAENSCQRFRNLKLPSFVNLQQQKPPTDHAIFPRPRSHRFRIRFITCIPTAITDRFIDPYPRMH